MLKGNIESSLAPHGCDKARKGTEGRAKKGEGTGKRD